MRMEMFGLYGTICTFSICSMNRKNELYFCNSHQLELNRERLFALLSHKIFVKIWDGKEFCTVRTRLDKPRIGRALPNLTSSNKYLLN